MDRRINFCWRKHFQKNCRLIDIAKILKYRLLICVKFNLPKVKYFCLMINFVFQRIRGYKICQIRTYGLGDMNFRSLSIFLKNNYGIYTMLTGVSPEFRRSWRRKGPDVHEWLNGGEEAETNLRDAEVRSSSSSGAVEKPPELRKRVNPGEQFLSE